MSASKGGGAAAGSGEPSSVNEAYYNEGATPLFLAIEEAEWREAMRIAQEDSAQVSTWVVSTGTVETTFHWNLWRRLPLHEACRRQAPAWFLSCLLSVYPLGARQRTQFGELPLHLAVECGSPPECVNLLIVAYWPAILATDQSGRTPMSILDDAEMLDMEEHKVVRESLMRSTETYQQIRNRHEKDIELLNATHAAGLQAIRKQHDDDLQVEQDEQEKLLQEVKRLKGIITEVEDASSQKSRRIDEAAAVNEALRLEVLTLQGALKEEQDRVQSVERRAQGLENTIQNRDSHIDGLDTKISELQNDLRQIALWQDQELQAKVNQTEDTVQVMVEHFCSLTESLGQHNNKVQQLLLARGIPSRGSKIGASGGNTLKLATDEKKDADQEDDSSEKEALDQAFSAASGALGLK